MHYTFFIVSHADINREDCINQITNSSQMNGDKLLHIAPVNHTHFDITAQ